MVLHYVILSSHFPQKRGTFLMVKANGLSEPAWNSRMVFGFYHFLKLKIIAAE